MVGPSPLQATLRETWPTSIIRCSRVSMGQGSCQLLFGSSTEVHAKHVVLAMIAANVFPMTHLHFSLLCSTLWIYVRGFCVCGVFVSVGSVNRSSVNRGVLYAYVICAHSIGRRR